MKIGRMLIPVAYSARCAWAVRYAAELAGQFGAELVFLHVSPVAGPGELARFVAKEIGALRHHCVELQGDPAEKIVEYAHQHQVDVILMPTRAHGKFRRLLLGSVTAKVLHDADCPVWTGVHHEGEPAAGGSSAKIHTIICAVDVDTACVPLIRQARELAVAMEAKLRVIHAIPAADERSDNAGEIELRKCLFRQSGEEFARLLGEAEVDVAVELRGGKVAQVVREAVLRERADLVVIGRGSAQGGLGRLRTGMYSIIRESPCPVLSI